MKRLIALLLALMLLAGCSAGEPEPSTAPPTAAPTTEPTTAPSVESTSPPGAPLYIPDSELEQQTNGAVKVYEAHKDCISVYPMGESLLFFFPKKANADQILLYGGEELYLRGAARPEILLLPDDQSVQITAEGVSYYRENQRQIVLLDSGLVEVDRIELPENTQGTPVVDLENKKAYFCTDTDIRVLDLETGIARLLRQESVVWHSVYDVCMDGRVLLCDVIDSNQNGYLAYIDTTTGKLLGKDTDGWDFDDYEDTFLLTNDGITALYGTWDTEVQELIPAGDVEQILEMLPLGSALTVIESDEGPLLELYDLETGMRTASLTLPEGKKLYSIVADGTNQCIWFLLAERNGEQVLCRWDPTMSPVTDETVYLEPCYSEDAPDVEGLSQMKTKADALAAANNMEIRIWKDAVQDPWTGKTSDYRVSSFRNTLEAMEYVLSAFPEGMLSEMASVSLNGTISVSIVLGEEEKAGSEFRWIDRSTYIALETGENGQEAFCNALYRVMDIYLLNSNSMLDEWDSDEPVSDRAKIFSYAMADDKAWFFEDDDNWDKLDQLCECIRDAFDLDDYEGEFLWEQYW